MRVKRFVYAGAAAVVLIVIFLIYPINALCQMSAMRTMTPLNDDNRPKVIYVIYDNSTSMVRDDKPTKYTTRWVEASYAIKALATMMNEQDVLRIYPISGSGKSDEIRFKGNTLEEVLKKLTMS